MLKNFSKRHAEAQKSAEERCSFTSQRIEKCFSKWKLSEEHASLTRALLGRGGRPDRLLASDLTALLKAGEVFRALVADVIQQHPDREFFFGTFVDDLGNTRDRAPVLRFSAFQQKVERTIRGLKLSGVAINGVHPFMNHPGGEHGRQISVDAHLILWTDGPFDHKAAEKALNNAGGWTSSLTHKPVQIKPLDGGQLAALCYYLFKPWHAAKNVTPHKTKPGRIRLHETRKGYRPEFVTRVFEGLSQVGLMDLVVGINGGKTLRQQFRTAMTTWHRARPEPVLVPESFDVWQHWASLREVNGSPKFKPFRFDLPTGPRIKPARVRPAPRRRSRNGPPIRSNQRHLGKRPPRNRSRNNAPDA